MRILGLSIPQVAARGTGAGAGYWASTQAPDGFRWVFVLDDLGRKVTAAGGTRNPEDEPVVALVEI